MLLFGGVPEIYYDRLTQRAIKELTHSFTGVPLRRDQQGSYLVDDQHCEELLSALVRYIGGRRGALDDGLCVIIALRPWEVDAFYRRFRPFSLYSAVVMQSSLIQSGGGAKVSANTYADAIIRSANKSIRAMKALKTEYETRLRRTPLLLPERHFGAAELTAMIDSISQQLADANDPTAFIQTACKTFEQEYAYERVGKRQGKFSNNNKIDFMTPGREQMHGCRASVATHPHSQMCIFNAHTRAGGPYSDGFHYDCTKNAKSYSGQFANCHDDLESREGKPHLNVYPNDYMR